MLVDWMLPDQSGLELTRAIKRNKDTQDLPVIMLTARAEEHDKVAGLEGGADDYVTKPFSPRELLARIQAVLRRSSPTAAGEAIEAGALKLDPVSHRVIAGEQTVSLGPTEYRLLQFFMEHPDRVYARSQLLDRVWGGNVYVEERTVDVHIRRLRKALEPFACDCAGADGPRFGVSFLDAARIGGSTDGRGSQRVSRPAWQHLLGIFGGLLAALACGWIIDRPGAVRLALPGRHRRVAGAQPHPFRALAALAQHPEAAGHGRPVGRSTVATANRLYQRKRFHKRRALTLLRELRRMTSAMPDGAILLGPTREILWFNPTAADWLGLRRKLDYGIRIDNLIRQPEFVEYVAGGGRGPGPRIHMPNLGDRWFAFNLITTSGRTCSC